MARKSSKKVGSSKMKMNTLQMASWVLVAVGALNWGLVGLANINLVESLFGGMPGLSQVVYIIIGLAGLYSVWGMFSMMNN